jgi:biotin carboxylase
LVASVAAVATEAGLPGVTLKSAVLCQDKALLKEALTLGGVPTPRGGVVDSYEDAKRLFRELGRVFIKPVVGFGGVGARRILSPDDFEDVFKGRDFKPVLMEEFAEGTMHDVNALFDLKGNYHPLGSFDRYFHEEYPVEIGACYPSRLAEDQVAELYRVTEAAARAVGISVGPVKADLVLTEDGLKVLEIAPRLHGPKGTLWLSSSASGASHLEAALQVLTGGVFDPGIFSVKPERVSMYRALLPGPGRLESISGIQDALGIKGVENVLLLAEVGGVIPAYRDSTGVPGYVFASGLSYEQAETSIQEAMKVVDLTVGKDG